MAFKDYKNYFPSIQAIPSGFQKIKFWSELLNWQKLFIIGLINNFLNTTILIEGHLLIHSQRITILSLTHHQTMLHERILLLALQFHMEQDHNQFRQPSIRLLILPWTLPQLLIFSILKQVWLGNVHPTFWVAHQYWSIVLRFFYRRFPA